MPTTPPPPPPAPAPQTTYALETLEATPPRVLLFLRALGTSLSIRTILSRHGYGRVEHDEGWRLLKACCDDPDLVWPAVLDEEAQDALIEVDSWDERGFAIVSATLWHKYPAQARFLLQGIGPSQGPAAVRGVSELLDRLDMLEKGATDAPEDDKKAMMAIAKRGLTKKERARLRELVIHAEQAITMSVRRAPSSTPREPMKDRLSALRDYYDEWSEIARATVTREDHLVKMGLARPRTPT